MADTTAYVQKLMDKEGNEIYPITTASAVYVQTTSGTTTSQQKLSDALSEMKTSFQDGCDTLVSKLTALGVTPASSSPADIAAAIDTLYANRYSAGVEQGHADVIADPGTYGLITEEAYESYGTTRYNAGYEAGKSAVTSSPNSYNLYTKTQYDANYANGIQAVKDDPGSYDLTTHGSVTKYFRVSHSGNNVYLRDTTNGADTQLAVYNMDNASGATAGYTFTW